jgi:hypothetical protein
MVLLFIVHLVAAVYSLILRAFVRKARAENKENGLQLRVQLQIMLLELLFLLRPLPCIPYNQCKKHDITNSHNVLIGRSWHNESYAIDKNPEYGYDDIYLAIRFIRQL